MIMIYIGLTFEKVRAHQVLVQDLGEGLEQDFGDRSHDDETNLKFFSGFTPKNENVHGNTIESGDCKDSGEWLVRSTRFNRSL